MNAFFEHHQNNIKFRYRCGSSSCEFQHGIGFCFACRTATSIRLGCPFRSKLMGLQDPRSLPSTFDGIWP